VGRLLAMSEAYPELRASSNMVRISEELGYAENQVCLARDAYNNQVHRSRALRDTLPQALLSQVLGFGDIPLFEADQEPAPPQAPRPGSVQA